jgi:hypothetical protein
MNMLLVAIGPICVAFAAHEKTESYFWSFLKAFLFVGLLYMPLLGLACQFAGVIMAQMTTMVTGSGLVYGDGSDIGVHILFVVLGPLCAFAAVRSAPMFLGMVLGAGGGGGGGSAAFAMAGAAVGRHVGGGEASAGGAAGQSATGAAAGGAAAGAVGAAAAGAAGGGSGGGSIADLRGE